jgi:hypothetical protein
MRYSNIHQHCKTKKDALRRIFYSTRETDYDAIVILGAQSNDETQDLVDIAKQREIPTFLYDIRSTELDKFESREGIVRHNVDLTKTEEIENILNSLKISNVKNPLIYDNLSGGKTRIEFLHQIVSKFYEVVLFTNVGHGMLSRVRDEFTVKDGLWLSDHNRLFIIKSKISQLTTKKTESKKNNRRPQCPNCYKVPGKHSILGQYLYWRKKTQDYRCCRCDSLFTEKDLVVPTSSTVAHYLTTAASTEETPSC